MKSQELIAIFMGMELREWFVKKSYCTDKHSAWFKGDVQVCAWNGLKYDHSWDWFMEAYRKAKDYLRDIERPSKNHCCLGDMIEVDVHCHVTEINLEKAFEELVKLVEWINLHESKKA